MSSGYRMKRVAETGEVQGGRQRSPHIKHGRKLPYLRVANVFDGRIDLQDLNEMYFSDAEIEKFQLVRGDILLNEGQSIELVGRAAMYLNGPKECCFQNTLVRYRANRETCAEFALQLFRYTQHIGYFSRIAVKTNSIAHLGVNRFADLELPFPQLDEQRRIAGVLRTWDQAIDAVSRLIAAKQRRLSWFRSNLLTGTRRLPGFKTDWKTVALGDVLNEHALKSTGAEEVFSVSVHKGLINQVEHLGRSFAAAKTDHYNRVFPGDIVYTKSPTGDFPLGIIKQSKVDRDVIVSPLYGVFTPETRELGLILDAYFQAPTTTTGYLNPLVQKGAKNTIACTNRRFLEGKLKLPRDPEEQKAIAAVMNDAFVEIDVLSQKLEALKRQKRGLMQKLLTGEWRVPEDAF